jgi:hypothetical protein
MVIFRPVEEEDDEEGLAEAWKEIQFYFTQGTVRQSQYIEEQNST